MLTTEALNVAALSLNTSFDPVKTNAPLAALGAVQDFPQDLEAATTEVAGVVLQAADSADIDPTIPAAAPAGGTGAAAGGWDTAGNRDAAIATINGLRTAVVEIVADLADLKAKLRTAGILEVVE